MEGSQCSFFSFTRSSSPTNGVSFSERWSSEQSFWRMAICDRSILLFLERRLSISRLILLCFSRIEAMATPISTSLFCISLCWFSASVCNCGRRFHCSKKTSSDSAGSNSTALAVLSYCSDRRARNERSFSVRSISLDNSSSRSPPFWATSRSSTLSLQIFR